MQVGTNEIRRARACRGQDQRQALAGQTSRPLRAPLAGGHESLAPIKEDRVKRKTESALPAKTPGSDLDAVQSLLASMTRKRTKTTERQSGNAALLAKAMEALKAIRELKGLDPLKQTEVTGPQGGPIQLTVREMTDEQLLALIARETAKQQAIAVESAPLPPPLPPPGSTETTEQPLENKTPQHFPSSDPDPSCTN